LVPFPSTITFQEFKTMQGIVHELSAIDRADLCLIRCRYSPSKRGRIRNTIWTHGELATAVLDGDLRPRDEQIVTDAYVAGLPDVPTDDPSWDSAVDQLQAGPVSRRPADWWLGTVTLTPADILVDSAWNPDDIPDTAPDDFDYDAPGPDGEKGGGLTPTPVDDDIPDAPDFRITRAPGYEADLNAVGIELMPVCGGAPDDEPFEPTAEDWADYREMQERTAVQAYFAHRGYNVPTDDELSQLASHGCI
jgi:hypothetical protein